MRQTETKDEIIRKTFVLLLKKGYNGVSITDIQQATGMSRGLLYHYFGSKEELFRITGETYLLDILRIHPENDGGIPEMIRYITAHYKDIFRGWKEMSGNDNITIANYDILFYQMMEREESLSKSYTKLRNNELVYWSNAASKSMERGEIRNTLAPGKIARHFTCLLDGIWMSSQDTVSIENVITHMREILMDYYRLLEV